ncbi:hypothetical protein [Cytophaga aurantiaca]|uniref:hypothetical protein n=1 Tax=Cytophaga aurantiaca TaxID=29530 RepID=UPI00035D0B32|nr:hypothetical protein [Cytophaga aurantiaca]
MHKLKLFNFILFSLFFVSATHVDIELETKSLLNDRIELKIPKDFKVMSAERIAIKYPKENPPSLVYTDESGGTNIAMNLTSSKASQDVLPSYKDYLVKTLSKMSPSLKWKSNGVTEINGRQVCYLEFITPGIDTEIYNLMFLTDVDGKLLICTFNCTKSDMKEWVPTAKEIMNSLKVK